MRRMTWILRAETQASCGCSERRTLTMNVRISTQERAALRLADLDDYESLIGKDLAAVLDRPCQICGVPFLELIDWEE